MCFLSESTQLHLKLLARGLRVCGRSRTQNQVCSDSRDQFLFPVMFLSIECLRHARPCSRHVYTNNLLSFSWQHQEMGIVIVPTLRWKMKPREILCSEETRSWKEVKTRCEPGQCLQKTRGGFCVSLPHSRGHQEHFNWSLKLEVYRPYSSTIIQNKIK